MQGLVLNCFVFLTAMHGAVAFADGLRQQAGFYRNDEGLERQRLRVESNFDVSARKISSLTSSNIVVGVERDIYRDLDAHDDKFGKEFFAGGRRIRDGWSLGWNNSFNKLTDTRIFASGQADGITSARNFALGLSRWFWHESMQINLDVSRTLAQRPELMVLDVDSTVINPPGHFSSTGTSIGLRHLATPTTITNYGVSLIASNDRPLRQDYSFGIKQFVRPFNGAVHFDLIRSLNRGKLEETTLDGQLTAWVGEIAYLQNILRGQFLRAAWRQYVEQEVTRAYQDVLVRGTDMWSLGVSNDLKKMNWIKAPVSVDLVYSRFRTNEMVISAQSKRINAQTFEFGATAKF
jgi:hypothetical protein